MTGWEVILTATPETTYRFVNWTVSGNEVSKENPYRAIVKTSTQFRANFEKDNYKVSVKEAEGGSVKASQKGDVLNGTKVTFTATPQEGFSFISWIVNGNEASKENPYIITITENTEVQASFITHKVTVTASEGGTAKASKMQVGHNAQVTFTVTPQENYGFVNWTVNGEVVSTSNPYTATIKEDIEIKANFATHKITIVASEGGTAEASKTQAGHNEKVTFTATSQDGYYFVNWTVNGAEVSKNKTYTAIITKDIEIKANFATCKKITVLTSEGGTAKASKTQVAPGEKVTFTATPQENYGFVNWTVNGEVVSNEVTYTATITEDIEIKANFITHKVTVLTSEGGTAEASKTQAGHNEKVSFTATPQENYGFVNWTVNGVKVSTNNPYTATITEDIEIKANFTKYASSPTGTENGKGYVDLGLSVKWATCNVGADSPEEYGDYFAWGETEPKTTYEWSTYKYCNGSSTIMTKYCVDSYYGTVDYKRTLLLSDDAAHVNWGGNWRMPTDAELYELGNTSNCTWTWTVQNGVKGYKVTSKKNGNSIFLPAVGFRNGDYLIFAGDAGNFWSSSLSTGNGGHAYGLSFFSNNVDRYGNYRCRGQSVRAVCE